MKKNLQSAFNQRQFMVKKDFEIYYYSNTGPLTIAPHTHPCYEFYFLLEGNASYTIKKTSYPLQFGDFLVVPPRRSTSRLNLQQYSPLSTFRFLGKHRLYEADSGRLSILDFYIPGTVLQETSLSFS